MSNIVPCADHQNSRRQDTWVDHEGKLPTLHWRLLSTHTFVGNIWLCGPTIAVTANDSLSMAAVLRVVIWLSTEWTAVYIVTWVCYTGLIPIIFAMAWSISKTVHVNRMFTSAHCVFSLLWPVVSLPVVVYSDLGPCPYEKLGFVHLFIVIVDRALVRAWSCRIVRWFIFPPRHRRSLFRAGVGDTGTPMPQFDAHFARHGIADLHCEVKIGCQITIIYIATL